MAPGWRDRRGGDLRPGGACTTGTRSVTRARPPATRVAGAPDSMGQTPAEPGGVDARPVASEHVVPALSDAAHPGSGPGPTTGAGPPARPSLGLTTRRDGRVPDGAGGGGRAARAREPAGPPRTVTPRHRTAAVGAPASRTPRRPPEGDTSRLAPARTAPVPYCPLRSRSAVAGTAPQTVSGQSARDRRGVSGRTASSQQAASEESAREQGTHEHACRQDHKDRSATRGQRSARAPASWARRERRRWSRASTTRRRSAAGASSFASSHPVVRRTAGCASATVPSAASWWCG